MRRGRLLMHTRNEGIIFRPGEQSMEHADFCRNWTNLRLEYRTGVIRYIGCPRLGHQECSHKPH